MRFRGLVCVCAAGWAAGQDSRCALAGNWSDGRGGRVQILQPPAYNYLSWRASKYQGAFSEGRSDPASETGWDHAGWLLMYEHQAQVPFKVSRSPHAVGAPDCSRIQVGGQEWCRYPFCPAPQPAWPAWPFASLDPDQPDFQPPDWPANWNLTESTAIMPGGSGPFNPGRPWGLVTLGGSGCSGARGSKRCMADWVAQCRALRGSGRAQRCFVYHNFELALEWIELQKVAMRDPAKRSWFLHWPNGSLYSTNIAAGDQYYWNYTVPQAAQYVVDSISEVMADPAVDGSYLDDGPFGLPLEKPHAVADLQLSIRGLVEYQAAAVATYQQLLARMISAHTYSFQQLGWYASSAQIGPTSCLAFMRRQCDPQMQRRSMMLHAQPEPGSHRVVLNQTVAAFLIVRPPVGFIGFGWPAQDAQWDPIFLLQPGRPVGACTEESNGVFAREWTRGKAVLDCSTWEATLPFESL